MRVRLIWTNPETLKNTTPLPLWAELTNHKPHMPHSPTTPQPHNPTTQGDWLQSSSCKDSYVGDEPRSLFMGPRHQCCLVPDTLATDNSNPCFVFVEPLESNVLQHYLEYCYQSCKIKNHVKLIGIR